MPRVQIFALALALVGSGCMFNPENGDTLCGANGTQIFSGYVPAPSAGIAFDVATSPSGPWTQFHSTTSGSQPLNYAGAEYYNFYTTAQIPAWTSDGGTLRTYVRARYLAGTYTIYLSTFDVPDQTTDPGLACINTRINANDTMAEAINACASGDRPVVTITAPAQSTCACTNTVVTQDLVIDDAVSAAEHVCTQQVTGDLTIGQGAPQVVPLPALTSIGGAVDFDYRFEEPNAPGAFSRRSVDAPALTTIGGDVRLTARRDFGDKQVPRGLDAVTSVGGDITLSLYDANPEVFNGLTSHTGDITIEGTGAGGLDINAGGSFGTLTTVTGDLRVNRFFNANGFFNSVQTVNGDVTVGALRLYPSPSFTSLQTVTGALTFDETDSLGPPWPTPTSVGGELRLFGSSTNALSNVPAAVTSAFGLRLENNAALNDLSGTIVQLTGGDVFISGNPQLPQCEVDAFLAAQTAGGWTGQAFVSGTTSCP